MSAFGLHPTFTSAAAYRAWRITWIRIHRDLLRRTRTAIRSERAPEIIEDMRVMAEKSRTLRRTAKERMARIDAMREQIRAQNEAFPIEMPTCSAIDFHFNKGSIEFPFLPAWIIKTKGNSYYVNHVEFDASGTTRETPDHASTKGSMRFRHAHLTIDREGNAMIRGRRSAMAF